MVVDEKDFFKFGSVQFQLVEYAHQPAQPSGITFNGYSSRIEEYWQQGPRGEVLFAECGPESFPRDADNVGCVVNVDSWGSWYDDFEGFLPPDRRGFGVQLDAFVLTFLHQPQKFHSGLLARVEVGRHQVTFIDRLDFVVFRITGNLDDSVRR